MANTYTQLNIHGIYAVKGRENIITKWIDENKFLTGKFHWQDGYAAFSYARSQRDRVIKYIMNQEAHHSVITF